MNAKKYVKEQLKYRRVFLWGEIKNKKAKTLILQMRHLLNKSTKPIFLYIHSPGGFIDAVDAIINEMLLVKSHGVDLNTIVHGNAFSAAADILCLGTKGCRWGMKHSSIMIHPISYGLETDYQMFQERMMEFYKKKSDALSKLVAETCGKNTKNKYQKFLQDIKESMWMTTEESIKYGFIDGLWTCENEERITQECDEDNNQ